MTRKRKSPVKIWEWYASLFLTLSSAGIIWTNESIDLLNKIGIIVAPGTATLIFLLIATSGASWFILNSLRHKRLI